MKRLTSFILIFLVFSPCFAGPAGFGFNYGQVGNFKMWNASATDSGSLLRVDYSYALNDNYTAGLQIGFIADQFVLNSSANRVNVETAAFLNVSNQLYLRKLGRLSPYLKLDTGIYGVNSWYKFGGQYYFTGTNILADVGLGAGVDFNILSARTNLELTLPALVHVMFFQSKLPYIISLGVKVSI